MLDPAARFLSAATAVPNGGKGEATAEQPHDTYLYRADDLTEEHKKLLESAGHTCGTRYGDLIAKHKNRTFLPPHFGLDAPVSSDEPEPEWLADPKRADELRGRRAYADQQRARRQAVDCRMADKGMCSCDIALVGDHMFFAGPNGQGNEHDAIQYMVNVLIETDALYRSTIFSDTYGFGFVIRSAEVFTDNSDNNPLNHNFGPGDGGLMLEAVTDNLGRFARFNKVCTTHVFTHNDFNEGILGFAWVGQPGGYGGICDSAFNKGFNTGINFGVVVTPYVASLVVAHELGHQFGAEHDPSVGIDGATYECSPGGTAGNFIMFPAATFGTQTNNRIFSQ